MPQRRCRALIAALCTFLAAPAGAAEVEYIGTYVWALPDTSFGGFSGLEISADGRGFHAVTDRAHLYWGSIDRDAEGRIRGMNLAGRAHLQDSKGRPLPEGLLGDSEGLAIGKDGRIWVSFEGLDRLALYNDPDQPAKRIPQPGILKDLRINEGMEALAIADDGALWALPEHSGRKSQPFPILRYREGRGWDSPRRLPREGRWLPVGSDIGPDGHFYLLERDFNGVLGFASRVLRFEMTPDGPRGGEVLLETRSLQYDNLEGIAVWDDGQGIRLTMISDDNFLFVQRTELVEYRIRD